MLCKLPTDILQHVIAFCVLACCSKDPDCFWWEGLPGRRKLAPLAWPKCVCWHLRFQWDLPAAHTAWRVATSRGPFRGLLDADLLAAKGITPRDLVRPLPSITKPEIEFVLLMPADAIKATLPVHMCFNELASEHARDMFGDCCASTSFAMPINDFIINGDDFLVTTLFATDQNKAVVPVCKNTCIMGDCDLITLDEADLHDYDYYKKACGDVERPVMRIRYDINDASFCLNFLKVHEGKIQPFLKHLVEEENGRFDYPITLISGSLIVNYSMIAMPSGVEQLLKRRVWG